MEEKSELMPQFPEKADPNVNNFLILGGGRGGRGGRGGFRGGRGGNFNPLDRAKKSGGIIQPTGKAVTTFSDDE